jgi:hypothetical protein
MGEKVITGDRSAGELATILGLASVVKTRPVSFKRSCQTKTSPDRNNKPAKTNLALVVEKEAIWMTSL